MCRFAEKNSNLKYTICLKTNKMLQSNSIASVKIATNTDKVRDFRFSAKENTRIRIKIKIASKSPQHVNLIFCNFFFILKNINIFVCV